MTTGTDLRHETFVIERHYPHPPERVFAAFSTPEAYAAWACPAPGLDVTCDPFEFRDGGVAVTHMDGGDEGVWVNTDRFAAIAPDRILQTTTLSGPDGLDSVTVVTLDFLAEPEGCRLKMTEQGAFFSGAEGAAMHREGWEAMFEGLAAYLDGGGRA